MLIGSPLWFELFEKWFQTSFITLIKPGLGPRLLAFFLIIAMAACSQVQEEILSEEPDAAEITFVALTNMSDWIEDPSNLRWGIAMSNRDITQVLERNGKRYNQPAIGVEDFGSHSIASNIQTQEQISLKIKPGTYDWLIILDEDNDGTWDSYLGSIEEDIKLNRMQFQANDKVKVIVDKDGVPRLFHENNN